MDEINLPAELPNLKKIMKRDTGNDPSCFELPESIDPSPSFWEIYTVNRHWLMKSVTRMRESGLSEKWEHWANWACKLEAKLFAVKELKSDIIDKHKLIFPLLVYLVFCGTGILILSCEYLKLFCKISL